jgi:hypothetical protein
MGRSFAIAAGLARAVILRSESHRTHDHILLSQIRDSHNLEDQVPVFIFLQRQGGPVITPATGFPFFASYDSQGYDRGIRPRLHTDPKKSCPPLLRVLALPVRQVSTDMFPSNGCCTVACLHSCYIAMSLHVTLFIY